MNILVSVYGDSTGGRWTATLKTSELLASEGNNVILLIDPIDRENIPLDFDSKIKILTLKNIGHYDIYASYLAKKILLEHRIQICICHSGRAIYLLKRAANKKIPVVAYNHSHNIKRTLKADAFICITPYMKMIIDKKTNGKKISSIISNSVAIPENLEINNNKILTIGSIARMAPNKGLEHLIYALAILKRNGLDFNAIIAGDGEDRVRLEQLCEINNISDSVSFIGWIRADDKAKFYATADIICFCSEWDIQPLVILESFAYAKALIATNIDGPSSMYTHEETALVINPKSPHELANAIQRLAHDRALLTTLGENARNRAIREHSEEVIKLKLNDFCKSIAHQE